MSAESLAFLSNPNDWSGADAIAIYDVWSAYEEAKRRVSILSRLLDEAKREIETERQRAITAETAMIRRQVLR
jgi:hypothetical protein